MNVTQNITLDLTKRAAFQYVSAKQGDNSSRFVKITLTDDGAVYRPEKGTSANFRAQKPDGTMVLNQAVMNDDGTVTVELTRQTLAVCGDVVADVYLTDGNGTLLSSVSFVIHVEAAPFGKNDDSNNEFLFLINLTEQAERAATQAEQAAGWAGESASTSGQKAKEASQSAVQAGQSATQAAQSAVQAGQSATTSGQKAEAAKQSAVQANQSVTQAVQVAGQAKQSAYTSGKKAEEASQSAIQAGQSAMQAAQSAEQAGESASASGQKAEEAKQSAAQAKQAATQAEQAANAAAADKLPLAGGKMRGPLDMGSNPVKNLPEPVGLSDAATKAYVIQCAHPVGSLYLSDNATSPASLFGGSWTKIVDRGLMGAGGAYAVGSTGGEASHTLTVEEMPSHNHNAEARYSKNNNSGQLIQGFASYNNPNWYNVDWPNVSKTGGGRAHNNLSPYYATYIWKRVS